MGNDSAGGGGGPGPHLGGSRTGVGWGYGGGANQGGSSGGPQGAGFAFGPSNDTFGYGSAQGLPQSLGGPNMPAGVNVGGGSGLSNMNAQMQPFSFPNMAQQGVNAQNFANNPSSLNLPQGFNPQPPSTIPQEPLQGPSGIMTPKPPTQGPGQMAGKGPQQQQTVQQGAPATAQGFRPGIDDRGGGNPGFAGAG